VIFTPPSRLPATLIGPKLFDWGSRTFVMSILNVTPDSFSGDGLLAGAGDDRDFAVSAAVGQARRMAAEGADILDIGGESTRPGHADVPEVDEIARVVPVIAAIHAALPEMPISIDTSKPAVAAATLDAGASLLNDVWGVRPDDSMFRLAAARAVPIVLMHNRLKAEYSDVVSEIVADLQAAIDRAVAAGVSRANVIVDPGFGFGKTPEQNLVALRGIARIRELGCPVLLGTSRKSTIGRILGGAEPGDRLEGTLASTALGIAAGADIVRVHDVRANAMAARVADAIVRGYTA
jgi:dihydropteroate synthase